MPGPREQIPCGVWGQALLAQAQGWPCWQAGSCFAPRPRGGSSGVTQGARTELPTAGREAAPLLPAVTQQESGGPTLKRERCREQHRPTVTWGGTWRSQQLTRSLVSARNPPHNLQKRTGSGSPTLQSLATQGAALSPRQQNHLESIPCSAKIHPVLGWSHLWGRREMRRVLSTLLLGAPLAASPGGRTHGTDHRDWGLDPMIWGLVPMISRGPFQPP